MLVKLSTSDLDLTTRGYYVDIIQDDRFGKWTSFREDTTPYGLSDMSRDIWSNNFIKRTLILVMATLCHIIVKARY